MKKWISLCIMCLVIPTTVLIGAIFFKDRQYAWTSLSVAVLSCIPFFLSFEKNEQNSKKMIIIAVMTALSIVGRLIFAPIPGFKPVTALVIISAIYLGSESGFIIGALSAVLSNFYFGQGPWTPFQMFVWGFIGLLAGLLSSPLKKRKLLLWLFGAASGVIFSVLMDVWTVLWADGVFNFSRYLAAIITAIPTTVTYSVSNVIFLLIFANPIGKALNRIIIKYQI